METSKWIMEREKYQFVSRDGYETELLVYRDYDGHVVRAIRIQGMRHD